LESVAVGDESSAKGEARADEKHSMEPERRLACLHEESPQHGGHSEGREHVAVNSGAASDSEDLVGHDRDHRRHGAVAHEREADDEEVSTSVVDRPVDSRQARQLDDEHDGVDRLEVVAVKDARPQNLEAAIEQCSS